MLWFFLSIGAILIVLAALYRRWQKKVDAEITEGAAVEWTYMLDHEPEFVDGMTEEQFRKVYARVHRPRFPGYALAAVATFLISLPVTLALLTGSVWAADQLGLTREPLEIVNYVNLGESKPAQSWQCGAQCQLYVAEAYSGFYYFFGVLIVWLLIVWFYMRRYHRRRPGYLHDELIREREGE